MERCFVFLRCKNQPFKTNHCTSHKEKSVFIGVSLSLLMTLSGADHCLHRSGNEEKLMALLTPLNVNCHASDGRKVNEMPDTLA